MAWAERAEELEARKKQNQYKDDDLDHLLELHSFAIAIFKTDIWRHEQRLKELDFDGTISIELEYSPEPDKIVEWVEEAYRETDALMQQVGLRS